MKRRGRKNRKEEWKDDNVDFPKIFKLRSRGGEFDKGRGSVMERNGRREKETEGEKETDSNFKAI